MSVKKIAGGSIWFFCFTDLPAGYQENNIQYREVHSSTSSDATVLIGDGLDTLFTTIPARRSSGVDDPDGHSEWMVKAGTKDKVIRAPGYPQPVAKTPRINYVIKATPDMGLGMFATRDIDLGDIILSERPLLVVPEVLAAPNVVIDKSYTEQQVQKIMFVQSEKMLEIAFNHMNDQDEKRYMALMNDHKVQTVRV